MHCGRHALNNLLGSAAFRSAELDEIAVSLARMHGSRIPQLAALSHRWPIIGNYDANVILLALGSKGFEVRSVCTPVGIRTSPQSIVEQMP